MASGCLARVVSSDARHNFLIHYLTAAGVMLLTPVIFGLSALDRELSAQPLEFMPPLAGLILLTPLFMPEQYDGIGDTVRSKRMSRQLVTAMRLLCSAVILAVLTGLLWTAMKLGDCDITAKMYGSAFIGALMLGSVGFFLSAVTDNAIVGYMTGMMYFLMSLLMRDRMGRFCLMPMTARVSGSTSVLLVTALVLIVGGMAYRRFVRWEK